MADVAMGTLGGNLKRKEKLTGRFADWFSWLFLAAAALRRFEAEGRRHDDLGVVHWVLEHAFERMQHARVGIYQNLRLPGLGHALRWTLGVLARVNPFGSGPSDGTGQRAARALLQPSGLRDRLTQRIHLDDDAANGMAGAHATAASQRSGLARLERALQLCVDAEPILKKLKDAVRAGRLPKARPTHLLEQALDNGILTTAERDLVKAAELARSEAVAVDSFTLAEYLATADAAARDPEPNAEFARPPR